MHFRRVTGGIRVSVTQPSTPASMEYRVAIWSFSIFNTKNAQKYQTFYLATQMEHDQSSYFCRGPDEFCWGLAPWAPRWRGWLYYWFPNWLIQISTIAECCTCSSASIKYFCPGHVLLLTPASLTTIQTEVRASSRQYCKSDVYYQKTIWKTKQILYKCRRPIKTNVVTTKWHYIIILRKPDKTVQARLGPDVPGPNVNLFYYLTVIISVIICTAHALFQMDVNRKKEGPFSKGWR